MLDDREREEMEQHIGADPERHPVIPGGGGVRKARWARPGAGKSGGVRVNELRKVVANLKAAGRQTGSG